MLTPTPTEVTTNLAHAGGRLAASWNEVLRILAAVLPLAITEANKPRNGGGFGLLLPQPQGYVVDGEKAMGLMPWLSVAATTETRPVAPDSHMDASQLTLMLAIPAPLSRRNLDDACDIACLIRAILWYAIGPWNDPQGKQTWSRLAPTGITVASPTELEKPYWGVVLHFAMDNYPYSNAFAPSVLAPGTLPSAAQVLAALPVSGGRLSLARNALLSILSTNLPTWIEQINTDYNLKLSVPANGESYPVYVLGEEVKQFGRPTVIVGASAQTVEYAPLVFCDNVELSTAFQFEHIEVRSQKDNSSDLVDVARKSLVFYQPGYIDGLGRRAWTELMPSAKTMGASDWHEGSGALLRHTALQGPNDVRW